MKKLLTLPGTWTVPVVLLGLIGLDAATKLLALYWLAGEPFPMPIINGVAWHYMETGLGLLGAFVPESWRGPAHVALAAGCCLGIASGLYAEMVERSLLTLPATMLLATCLSSWGEYFASGVVTRFIMITPPSGDGVMVNIGILAGVLGLALLVAVSIHESVARALRARAAR